MLTTAELDSIGEARLKDAEILLDKGRFEGAFYLCGYAIECALKARICKTLGWAGFPSASSEFRELLSLKTHNLETLLHLSGREVQVKTTLFPEWSLATGWDPEVRYRPIGKIPEAEARSMIESTRTLLKAL